MNNILKRLEQLYCINNIPSKLLHDGDMLVTFPTLRLDGRRTQIQINVTNNPMSPYLYRFTVYGIGKATDFNALDKIERFNQKHYDEMGIYIDKNKDYYLLQDIMISNPCVDNIHDCISEIQEFIRNNLYEIKEIVGTLE